MGMTRRQTLKVAGAVAAFGELASRPTRAADVLTVAAYGGEYRDIFIKTVIEPFEKKFSCKIVYDDSGGVDPYPRIRASRGSPGFDVAAEMVVPTIILGAKENLLEPITAKEVPNLKYAFKKSAELIPPYGIVQTYQYLALMWNKNKLEKPDSWLDYWQAPKRYGESIKGHLVTHSPANFQLAAYALIMGARAAGGDEQNMDKAWNMLRALKPYIGMTAASSAQAVPYMENEQVWLMPYWSARSALYASRGLPYGMTVPKEGTVALANTAGVPIGCSNKKLAFEFLNFRLEPDIQRAFCLGYFASPGRPDITDWPASFAEQQIATEQKMASMVFPNDAYLAQHQRDWTLTWQEIMGG